MRFDRDEFFGEYNELITHLNDEFDGTFAALASPLLSKQETVSNLYQTIVAERSNGVGIGFPWKEIALFLPRLFRIFFRLCYASVFFRVENLPTRAICFSSWLEPGCIRGSSLIDEHFRSIPEDVARIAPVIVLQQSYDHALLKKVRSIRRPNNYVIADGLLTIGDVFRVISAYLATAKLKLKGDYFLKGENVSRIVRRALLAEFLSFKPFLAYQKRAISLRLVRYQPRAFIYVFENQSWEKVCCKLLRAASVKLIGVQGSGFSPVFLNFFPTALDAEKQPMPDVIFTVGDLFRRYLATHGNYNIPIKTFGASRFPYPTDGSKFLVALPKSSIFHRILYAFSVHVMQYPSILSDLISIFEGTDIKVDLKLHPQFRPEAIPGFESLPSGFEIVRSVDMGRLSSIYDCVIFNDNSFGIEAIIGGVKSYQYNREGDFIDERLFYFDLWNAQLDLTGLIELRNQLLNNHHDKNFDVVAATSYINQMYRPYEGDVGMLLDASGAHEI